MLVLVLPYTAAEVVAEMGRGPWDHAFDVTHQDALGVRLASWVASGITLEDFCVLAQYNQVSGVTMNARGLADADVMAKVVHARRVLAERQDRLDMLRDFQVK